MGTDLVLYYLQDCEGNEVPGDGDLGEDYFDIRQNNINIGNTTCDRDLKCCKKSVSVKPPQPMTDVGVKCEIFARNGFQCVEKSKCLSKVRGNDEGMPLYFLDNKLSKTELNYSMMYFIRT